MKQIKFEMEQKESSKGKEDRRGEERLSDIFLKSIHADEVVEAAIH